MWKITILLCCLLGLSLSGAELLTEGGRSRYEIVLPADAVPAEQTAARELQSFLKQISGVELPIVASPSGPAIFIGQSPETASALGIPDWKRLKPDEIRLKSAGGNLYLAGDRPRGTLYAVYELLEKEFGVRFWTADATHVPKREKLELPQIDLRYAPPFEVRAAGYDLIRHDPRFSAVPGITDTELWIRSNGAVRSSCSAASTPSVKTCRCSPGTRILRPIRNGFPNGTGSGFRASFA